MIDKLIWSVTVGASTLTVAKLGSVMVPIITATLAQVAMVLNGGCF